MDDVCEPLTQAELAEYVRLSDKLFWKMEMLGLRAPAAGLAFSGETQVLTVRDGHELRTVPIHLLLNTLTDEMRCNFLMWYEACAQQKSARLRIADADGMRELAAPADTAGVATINAYRAHHVKREAEAQVRLAAVAQTWNRPRTEDHGNTWPAFPIDRSRR